MTRTGAVDTLLHSKNILLRTWFNTLMHVVNESSGSQHPAAFLLAGVLARRLAYRCDSHPAKRAMHSERKFFCVRQRLKLCSWSLLLVANMALKISKESMWFEHKPMWEKVSDKGSHSDFIILIIG